MTSYTLKFDMYINVRLGRRKLFVINSNMFGSPHWSTRHRLIVLIGLHRLNQVASSWAWARSISHMAHFPSSIYGHAHYWLILQRSTMRIRNAIHDTIFVLVTFLWPTWYHANNSSIKPYTLLQRWTTRSQRLMNKMSKANKFSY